MNSAINAIPLAWQRKQVRPGNPADKENSDRRGSDNNEHLTKHKHAEQAELLPIASRGHVQAQSGLQVVSRRSLQASIEYREEIVGALVRATAAIAGER